MMVRAIDPETLRSLNNGAYDVVVEDLYKRTTNEKPLKFRIHIAQDKIHCDKIPDVENCLGLTTLTVQIAFLLRDGLK